MHEIQVFASAGYFVFFCNPRGSEGRGNAFADIRKQFGDIDYIDFMEFTDTVLENIQILIKQNWLLKVEVMVDL